MYLAILDDNGFELPIPRVVLFDVPFCLSPPRNGGYDYTVINAAPIISGPLNAKSGWAAALGVCYEVDCPPFVVVPLEHGRRMSFGESLGIAPGKLMFENKLTGPSGRQVPDPEPKTSGDRLKSRV